ncbi:MAG: 3-isopropylmalate dehydratase large subunit [Actinomycetota bacterium]
MAARTAIDRIWDEHLVADDLIFCDLHLVQEVSSPQAFDELRLAGRGVRRPDRTVATADHAVPTAGRALPIADDMARRQVEALERNVADFAVPYLRYRSSGQGIVHVIGPDLGLTQPGMTIMCGDSHTSTHGAFGALAFGIGTSEVGHVLATQTLVQTRQPQLRVTFAGTRGAGVTAKDMVLALIRQIGTAGATGHFVEYAGPAIEALSMEGRMTVCNMTVEAGARAGLVAADDATFAYLEGRPCVPADYAAAVARWRGYRTDPDAVFDREVVVDVDALAPTVTWGTNPGQSVPVTDPVPEPADDGDARALAYMGLTAGEPLLGLPVDRVFIGSCTNGRIEDLEAAAAVLGGRRVKDGVRVLVVPGSMAVKAEAERRGLADLFTAAGAEWRDAGCSMCVGMNEDILAPGERCASTSNRNFEGRQGRLGRTHLMSPAMAAAAAVEGRIADVRELVG